MNQLPYEIPIVTEEATVLAVSADLDGGGSQPMTPDDPEW